MSTTSERLHSDFELLAFEDKITLAVFCGRELVNDPPWLEWANDWIKGARSKEKTMDRLYTCALVCGLCKEVDTQKIAAISSLINRAALWYLYAGRRSEWGRHTNTAKENAMREIDTMIEMIEQLPNCENVIKKATEAYQALSTL